MAKFENQKSRKAVGRYDLVDSLIADWTRERPELNVAPMQIVGRLILLGRKLESRVSTVLKSHDLKYSDFDVLATLRRSGTPYIMTPKTLMCSVLITSGAMTTLLGRLERRNLIKRGASKADGRIRTVILTSSAKKLVDKAVPERFAEAAAAIAGLAKTDQAQLAKTLVGLGIWLDENPLDNAPSFNKE